MATRPSELVYAVDERPPWPKLLVLALQHTSLMCVYLVLVPIVARAADAPHEFMVNAISLGMVALAIASVLQALPMGAFGSGYLAVPVYSAIYLGPSVMAAKVGGLPAVFGMTIFAGAVEIGLSRILRRLRPIFPPAVSGFTVAIVGIELGLVGMDQTLGIEIYGQPDRPGLPPVIAGGWRTSGGGAGSCWLRHQHAEPDHRVPARGKGRAWTGARRA